MHLRAAVRIFPVVCVCLAGRCFADYALPEVEERLVLLLPLSQIKLDSQTLSLSTPRVTYRFAVDTFWMQDRIWSDGICVGVKEADPKSAHYRVQEVRRAISRDRTSSVLVELVRPRSTKQFIVSYLRLFDPATEYPRYFPQRQFYDTVELPLTVAPKDVDELVAGLGKATTEALKRLSRSPENSAR